MENEPKLKSPLPGYEWVPSGKDLIFPDGTVEKGYVLKKINVPEPTDDQK